MKKELPGLLLFILIAPRQEQQQGMPVGLSRAVALKTWIRTIPSPSCASSQDDPRSSPVLPVMAPCVLSPPCAT